MLLGNQIAGAKLERTLKDALPMLGLGLIVLLLVTYVPAVTTWLPSVFGGWWKKSETLLENLLSHLE